MYAENLSFALILFAILRAISIGTKLLAPERQQFYHHELGSITEFGIVCIFIRWTQNQGVVSEMDTTGLCTNILLRMGVYSLVRSYKRRNREL